MEGCQGYAFISDAVEGMADEQVLAIAKNALAWERESVKRLAGFVRRLEEELAEAGG
jgi:hypothetical protein